MMSHRRKGREWRRLMTVRHVRSARVSTLHRSSIASISNSRPAESSDRCSCCYAATVASKLYSCRSIAIWMQRDA